MKKISILIFYALIAAWMLSGCKKDSDPAESLVGDNKSKANVFKDCKAGGSVNGTVLNADNFESFLAGDTEEGKITGTTYAQ